MNAKPTTYIIGGVPRSGKSRVSEYLLEKYKIPGITTDLLREAFGLGVPDFGIRSEDMKQTDKERSHILWPYFKGLIMARKNYDNRFVFEGTNFLPELLNQVKELTYIRICFLGFPKISPKEKAVLIRENENSVASWTNEMSDKEILGLSSYLIQLSKEFETECKKYGFRFFDTSENFEKIVKEIGEFLVN